MNKKSASVPEVVAFQNADAEKLAELFNSFDQGDLWPGGFTGGVPYTAERVLSTLSALYGTPPVKPPGQRSP